MTIEDPNLSGKPLTQEAAANLFVVTFFVSSGNAGLQRSFFEYIHQKFPQISVPSSVSEESLVQAAKTKLESMTKAGQHPPQPHDEIETVGRLQAKKLVKILNGEERSRPRDVVLLELSREMIIADNQRLGKADATQLSEQARRSFCSYISGSLLSGIPELQTMFQDINEYIASWQNRSPLNDAERSFVNITLPLVPTLQTRYNSTSPRIPLQLV